MMKLLITHLLLLLLFPLVCMANTNLNDLDYKIYPQRTAEEAAVLEWGHSAIISALDVSVAHFGPQTSDAALLEVECMPIIASPMNGIDKNSGKPVDKLENADDTHGNMVVMTNTGNLSGMRMAQIAINSGAAALLVVNMDQDHPDDIYRLEAGDDDDDDDENDVKVDIPVCMISLSSANVLTTATVTPDMAKEDVVNNGMPDRVRLYAGGDRPFFEDVQPVDPTLYLIHNLLTPDECKTLVSHASNTMDDGNLLLSHDGSKQEGLTSVVLWKGAMQSYAGKQVEERTEQVTGFPSTHYSDFVVYTLKKGSLWQPHYDVLLDGEVPMATITVFLSDAPTSPEVVYPSLEEPSKILPQQGMAIVHHNLDNDSQQLDVKTLHAWMPSTSDDVVHVAQKFVFSQPPSTARRIVLPLFAAPFGGKLPKVFYKLHAIMVTKFGYESGNVYFDKLCVFVPLLMVLCAAQAVANYVQESLKSKSKKSAASTNVGNTPSSKRLKMSKKKD